ncbi:MAG: T9SS type A sorting domain-containing protein, partial [Flavobacteriales bacterium]|nr:T9SS type A sorting domain-containing protein [Flavobacteriales bacterium]
TQLIADEWNITYQPRYFVVCPDGTFQSELVTPIYSNPQPLIDMSEECESVTSILDTSLEDDFSIINTSVENTLFYQSQALRMEYRIMDLTGSVNSSGQLQSGNGQLDLSKLPKGMYLMQVTDGSSILTKRIIKKS